MRLGVIARSEDRGLGNQTLEVCRHMNPDRVILVDMGTLAGHFNTHHDRFAQWNTQIVDHLRMSDASIVGPLVKALDVVYFAETPYARWEFCDIARMKGCATVCHLNPEFFAHAGEPELPSPSGWWLPSQWLRNDPRLPQQASYMPMPCPTDRWDGLVREPYDGSRPLRILHVAGHAAMGDRNGTRSLLASLRLVSQPVKVTVTTQDRHLPSPQRLPRNVTYRSTAGTANYWDLYAGHDVIVLPRRYGGLCLPAIEAAGAGMAIVMTDTSPNVEYPALLVKAVKGKVPLPVKLGDIDAVTVDYAALAQTIDSLAAEPWRVASLQGMAREWAKDMSWEQWAPIWHQRLRELRP